MGYNELVRLWISYLKNNQIVSMQSDPESGRLKYRRPVRSSDIVEFLQVKTDFSDNDINKAIDSVVGKNKRNNEIVPINTDTYIPPEQHTPPDRSKPRQKKYNTDDATDVEPRYGPRPVLPNFAPTLTTNSTSSDSSPSSGPADNITAKKAHGGKKPGILSQTPNAIRKRQARANRKARITEDFVDSPGEELSERDIENIFKLLITSPSKADNTSIKKKNIAKIRNAELKKLQEVIANTMSPSQRKQLWDALQPTDVQEQYVERNEADSILKNISRNSYYNDKIDLNDLRSAWAKAGYPEDTDEIKKLLIKFGFDEDIIDKSISNVLDPDNVDPVPKESASQAIVKIADYIKKAGLTRDIVKFIQENFADDIEEPKQSLFKRAVNYGKNLFRRKATTEDVKNIFTMILKEDRKDLSYIIELDELSRLGRNKK